MLTIPEGVVATHPDRVDWAVDPNAGQCSRLGEGAVVNPLRVGNAFHLGLTGTLAPDDVFEQYESKCDGDDDLELGDLVILEVFVLVP